jgi:hypothetical protein
MAARLGLGWVLVARSRALRLIATLVTVCASALGVGTVGAGAAHAVPGLLQCQGTETDSYSPGVIFQAREFTITLVGQFELCSDSEGHVASGSYGQEQFTITAGCNDLLDGFSGSRTFNWNTGDNSVMVATGDSTEVAGQVITTLTGVINSGRFEGRTAVQTITLPQPGLLQCLTTGYTGATGVTTLVII